MIYLLYTFNILLLIDYWAQSGPLDLHRDWHTTLFNFILVWAVGSVSEINLYEMEGPDLLISSIQL